MIKSLVGKLTWQVGSGESSGGQMWANKTLKPNFSVLQHHVWTISISTYAPKGPYFYPSFMG